MTGFDLILVSALITGVLMGSTPGGRAVLKAGASTGRVVSGGVLSGARDGAVSAWLAGQPRRAAARDKRREVLSKSKPGRVLLRVGWVSAGVNRAGWAAVRTAAPVVSGTVRGAVAGGRQAWRAVHPADPHKGTAENAGCVGCGRDEFQYLVADEREPWCEACFKASKTLRTIPHIRLAEPVIDMPWADLPAFEASIPEPAATAAPTPQPLPMPRPGRSTTPTTGGTVSIPTEITDLTSLQQLARYVAAQAEDSEFIQLMRACQSLPDDMRDFGGEAGTVVASFAEVASSFGRLAGELQDSAALVDSTAGNLIGA